MEMINVLKRLTELDAKNPKIVKENAPVEECGMMGNTMMGSMPQEHHTPASINITANDGDELSNMMRTIMTMAGKSSMDMDHDHSAMPVTTPAEIEIDGEPMGNEGPPEPSVDMRAVIDRLHDVGDEETGDEETGDEEATDEGMYDNSPGEEVEEYNAMRNHGDRNKNTAGGGLDQRGHHRLTTQPTATFEDIVNGLFKDYESFLGEAKIKCCCEKEGKTRCPVHGKKK